MVPKVNKDNDDIKGMMSYTLSDEKLTTAKLQHVNDNDAYLGPESAN